MAQVNGSILSTLDDSDYDGNLCVPLYKKAASKNNLDMIAVVNYPAYLGYFSKPVSDGLDCCGYFYGLAEFLAAKYNIFFDQQTVSVEEFQRKLNKCITEQSDLNIKNYLTKLRNVVIVEHHDTIDLLDTFKKLHAATLMRIVQDIWNCTSINEGSYLPKLLFCNGGVSKKMAFKPSGNSVVVNDDLLTYQKWLNLDVRYLHDNVEDVVNRYCGGYMYVDFNGSPSYYKSGMFEGVNVKGLYAMNCVESTDVPLTLFVSKLTNRTPFSTMNSFYDPDKSHTLYSDMTNNNVKIHMSTNNEVNRFLQIDRDEIWNIVKVSLDENNPSFQDVKESFHAYYSKNQKYKVFDLLSGMHLVRDVLSKITYSESKFSMYFDKKYGVAVLCDKADTDENVYNFIKYQINNHKNKDKTEFDWLILNDIMFDNGKFKGNFTSFPIASVTRVIDCSKLHDVFKYCDYFSLSQTIVTI